jgi:drug/metabolite transporter (DMT)-like permease
MKNIAAVGPLSVLLGAISYGMPGVVLSMAGERGVRIENLIPTQFLVSFIIFFMASQISGYGGYHIRRKDKLVIIATGIPLCCVLYCFFNAVNMIGVPLSTLLMMQSAWVAPLITSFMRREKISALGWVNLLLVLLGVVVATGVLRGKNDYNLQGIVWGMLAGLCYSLIIVSSSNVANGVRVVDKAKLLTFGAFITSVIIFYHSINISPASSDALWACINGVFSSIIPVVLFGFGMPKTSTALSGMLVATELPAAFVFSHYILSSNITKDQIIGCAIIISSIFISVLFSNFNSERKNIGGSL